MIDKNKFGPWAIVTGASSGIGKEFARRLAMGGFNLVLAARRLSLLDEIGRDLASTYHIECRAIAVDLSGENFMNLITGVTDALDIGLVVSNAGTAQPGEFIDMDLSKLERMVRLNVNAHLSITHYFGKKLAERGRGGMILVSAMGALQGVPFMSNAAATKAFVLSLGEGLHEEFKRLGINLTVLLPGATNTEAVKELGFTADTLPMKPMSVEQVVSEALNALCANRSSIIPGRLNRIMKAILPSNFTRNMMAKMIAKGNNIKI